MWLPFLDSSVAPLAMLNTPVLDVVLVPWNSIVPALTLTVPVLLKTASTEVTVFACLL